MERFCPKGDGGWVGRRETITKSRKSERSSISNGVKSYGRFVPSHQLKVGGEVPNPSDGMTFRVAWVLCSRQSKRTDRCCPDKIAPRSPHNKKNASAQCSPLFTYVSIHKQLHAQTTRSVDACHLQKTMKMEKHAKPK